MTITRAQQAAMPRRTPTEIAEEAYEASRATRRYRDVTGPAGVPIPDPRTGWRASSDDRLLGRICLAAFTAHRLSILTPERETAMVAVLAAALLAEFPQADMKVLQRYQLASVRGRVGVELGKYGYQQFTLPEPILLPNGKGGFHTGTGSGQPLPEAVLPYFDDRAAIESIKTPEFRNAEPWPSQFKARSGRWPFWREIEAAFPRVAAWMAAERAAA